MPSSVFFRPLSIFYLMSRVVNQQQQRRSGRTDGQTDWYLDSPISRWTNCIRGPMARFVAFNRITGRKEGSQDEESAGFRLSGAESGWMRQEIEEAKQHKMSTALVHFS